MKIGGQLGIVECGHPKLSVFWRGRVKKLSLKGRCVVCGGLLVLSILIFRLVDSDPAPPEVAVEEESDQPVVSQEEAALTREPVFIVPEPVEQVATKLEPEQVQEPEPESITEEEPATEPGLFQAEVQLTIRKNKPFGGVAWSPDGTRLATVSPGRQKTNGELQVWSAVGGEEVLLINGFPGGFFSVAWSPDGLMLASGCALSWTAGAVKIWDSATGEPISALEGEGFLHKVCWSPDGTKVASGSTYKAAQVWDARTGERLYTLGGREGSMVNVSWSPDGARLVTGSRDGLFKLWDAGSGELIQTFEGRFPMVACIAWCPKGNTIAAMAVHGPGLKIWNAESGEPVYGIDAESSSREQQFIDPDCWTYYRSGNVAWSPNGEFLLGRFGIWSQSTGKVLKYKPDIQGLNQAWRFDGQRFAVCSGPLVRVWEVPSTE